MEGLGCLGQITPRRNMLELPESKTNKIEVLITNYGVKSLSLSAPIITFTKEEATKVV